MIKSAAEGDGRGFVNGLISFNGDDVLHAQGEQSLATLSEWQAETTASLNSDAAPASVQLNRV